MSSHSIRLSTQARRDVTSLLQYSLERWGEKSHQVYAEAIDQALETLRQFPTIGRIRDDIEPGLHGSFVKRHLILYRIEENVVVVTRVLHHRMDAFVQDDLSQR